MYYIKRPDEISLLKYSLVFGDNFFYDDYIVAIRPSCITSLNLIRVNSETGEEESLRADNLDSLVNPSDKSLTLSNIIYNRDDFIICSLDCYNNYIHNACVSASEPKGTRGYFRCVNGLYYNGKLVDINYDRRTIVRALNSWGTSAIVSSESNISVFGGIVLRLALIHKGKPVRFIELDIDALACDLNENKQARELLEELKRLE